MGDGFSWRFMVVLLLWWFWGLLFGDVSWFCVGILGRLCGWLVWFFWCLLCFLVCVRFGCFCFVIDCSCCSEVDVFWVVGYFEFWFWKVRLLLLLGDVWCGVIVVCLVLFVFLLGVWFLVCCIDSIGVFVFCYFVYVIRIFVGICVWNGLRCDCRCWSLGDFCLLKFIVCFWWWWCDYWYWGNIRFCVCWFCLCFVLLLWLFFWKW